MSRVKTIIALIFAVCVALFAVQNYEDVVIKFLFYNFRISQALIIVLTTAFGVVIGMVAGLNSAFRASKNTKKLNKYNSQAQEQLQKLEKEKQELQEQVSTLKEQIASLASPLDSDNIIDTSSVDV